MRLTKPTDTKPATIQGQPNKKFHTVVTHHEGSGSTHHMSSHPSKEAAKAHYAAKFPKAHKIDCKEC